VPRPTTVPASPERGDVAGRQPGPGGRQGADGTALPYLPSLDGLRAVAITLVLVYHLRPAVLPGGFIGVDVFFVISGFLICAPIIRAIESGDPVSPARFLFRRARRLLPAVFVVVGATAVAFAQLSSTDLHRLRRHSVSSLAYWMNWTLAHERLSYTDLVQGASPLRHMWSLAIEEQFYVVVAILLVVWASVRRRLDTANARVAIACAAAGLAACSALAMWLHAPSPHDNARAYYGTDTRAQALLVGIVAAALVDPWSRRARSRAAIAWTGCSIVVLALVAGGTNEQSEVLYRGGFLLVAAASALLIAGALHDGALRSLLATRPAVTVGRLSYSLYLWHWPVIVFARRRWPDAAGLGTDLAIVAATFALATVTFAVVEQPARRRLGRTIPAPTSVAMLGAAALLAVTTSVVATDVDHDPADVSAGVSVPATFPDRSAPPVTVGAAPVVSVRRAVIVGDSMAHTLAGGRVADFPNFTPWSPEQSSFAGTSFDVVSIARPACSFLDGDVAYVRPDGTWYTAELSTYCGDWRDELGRLLDARPPVDAVVVALSNDVEDRALDGRLLRFGTGAYRALLRAFLDSVHSMLPPATRLVLVAGPPRSPAPDTDPGAWREIEMRSILRDEAARLDGTVFVDLGELVCPADDCAHPAPGFEPGGRADGLHFTPAGSRQAAAWLAERLDTALSA
jgi:peptidoglycan/LPS O-acetylase OafA/YrhL